MKCVTRDEEIYDLCHQISKEKDSDKLLALVQQLTQLLAEEQDDIKAKIRANSSKT